MLVHEENYVSRFLSGKLEESEVRRIGLRPWKHSIMRENPSVDRALEALDVVLDGQLMAGNLAGGTHHAFKSEGAGYCIFNDLAICAEKAFAEFSDQTDSNPRSGCASGRRNSKILIKMIAFSPYRFMGKQFPIS